MAMLALLISPKQAQQGGKPMTLTKKQEGQIRELLIGWNG